MSGKQYFCDCCRKMGMDSAALFKIGEQNAQCYGGYVYHCPTRLRGPSHRFVVNYIEEPGYARQRKEDGFPRAEKRIGAFVGGRGARRFQNDAWRRPAERDGVRVRSGGGDAFSSNGARKDDKINQSEHICEGKTVWNYCRKNG